MRNYLVTLHLVIYKRISRITELCSSFIKGFDHVQIEEHPLFHKKRLANKHKGVHNR